MAFLKWKIAFSTSKKIIYSQEKKDKKKKFNTLTDWEVGADPNYIYTILEFKFLQTIIIHSLPIKTFQLIDTVLIQTFTHSWYNVTVVLWEFFYEIANCKVSKVCDIWEDCSSERRYFQHIKFLHKGEWECEVIAEYDDGSSHFPYLLPSKPVTIYSWCSFNCIYMK